MSDWVIWSEEHGAWWMPASMGYTRSLRDAGRYSEEKAKGIADNANCWLPKGSPPNEVAMPDPWPKASDGLRWEMNTNEPTIPPDGPTYKVRHED